MARLEPALVMADGLVAVAYGELDMIEAVIGQRGLEVRFVSPCRRKLLIVAPVQRPCFIGFAEMFRQRETIGVGIRHTDFRYRIADALQVALTDEPGVITRGAQDIDE